MINHNLQLISRRALKVADLIRAWEGGGGIPNFLVRIFWFGFSGSDCLVRIFWFGLSGSGILVLVRTFWFGFSGSGSDFLVRSFWLGFSGSEFLVRISWFGFSGSNLLVRIFWFGRGLLIRGHGYNVAVIDRTGWGGGRTHCHAARQNHRHCVVTIR